MQVLGLSGSARSQLCTRVYGWIVAIASNLVIEDKLVVELKTVQELSPVHEAQLLTYLKLSGLTVGLLINFNVPVLRRGIKRIVNHFDEGAARGRDDSRAESQGTKTVQQGKT